MFLSATLLLAPISQIGEMQVGLTVDLVGAAIFFVCAGVNAKFGRDNSVDVAVA